MCAREKTNSFLLLPVCIVELHCRLESCTHEHEQDTDNISVIN